MAKTMPVTLNGTPIKLPASPEARLAKMQKMARDASKEAEGTGHGHLIASLGIRAPDSNKPVCVVAKAGEIYEEVLDRLGQLFDVKIPVQPPGLRA